MPEYKKGIYFCLSTAFISGLAIFINKFGVKGINPFVFTTAKNIVVSLLLFSFIFLSREIKTLKKLKFKDLIKLFLLGFIGGSLPFLLFFKGLSLSSPVQASFIHKNMFLLVALLAPFFLKEKLNKNFFIAALFLLLGNMFFLGSFNYSFVNIGSLYILGATFLWALETIIAKKTLAHLPVKIVSLGRMGFGSIFLLGFLSLTQKTPFLVFLSFKEISWILLTALFLFFYIFTWYNGLKYLSASTAAAILTLGAPITLILNLFYYKELSINNFFGLVLIFLGILLLLKLPKTFSSHNAQQALKIK